jgi:two-component system, chemotaxis family, chemotaxis protein CheY
MEKTLLIADDAAILRVKIKEAAHSIGWTVVGEARNGKEAVELFGKLRPTATTLDLVMPECDGIYALREILAMDPEAKVIVVSAIGQRTVLRDACQIGATDFILKPFTKDAIVNAIAQLTPAETSLATPVS